MNEVLDYIRAHPGCTTTAVSEEVRGSGHFTGWILTRSDIDRLIAAGEVEERQYRGVTVFYAKGHS